MKVQYRIAILLMIIVPALNACKKSFLELNPYDSFPAASAIKSEADLNTAVNGMYSGMTSSSLYGRLLPVRGDLSADNVYLKTGNSGRYLVFRDFNQTVANSDASNLWTISYDVIKRTNTVISAEVPSSPNVDGLKGEAYAIRALIHFELVRNFATPYTVDQNALGIPIVTSFDLTSQPGRSTVKEVYTQIVDDLNKAYSMITLNQGDEMHFSATNSTRIESSHFVSKYAVKALLARVYQTMGDWANARDAALDVVNNGGFSLVSKAAYLGYWADPGAITDRTETLFEVEVDAVTNAGTNSLSNFYSLSGYGDLFTPDDFYNSYAATDVRKSIILVNTTAVPGKTVYINNKYSNNTNPDDKDNIKVTRYADVLLILAEAYANLNDDVNARLRLNQVAQTRDDAFAGYASAGATLKTDIINERRKELAFEGQRYYDFLRLNLPIDNHLKSQSPLVVFPIAANNPKRIFPIPQVEIDANTGIRGQQNAGY